MIFDLILQNGVYGVAIVSIIVSAIVTGFQKFLVDQNKMRYIKKEMETIKNEIENAKKNKDEKKLKDLWEKSLNTSHQQFSMSMKPLLLSMVVVLLVFNWVGNTYAALSITLPFKLPIFGAAVGWLGLYIIISFPATIIFRKMLDL